MCKNSFYCYRENLRKSDAHIAWVRLFFAFFSILKTSPLIMVEFCVKIVNILTRFRIIYFWRESWIRGVRLWGKFVRGALLRRHIVHAAKVHPLLGSRLKSASAPAGFQTLLLLAGFWGGSTASSTNFPASTKTAQPASRPLLFAHPCSRAYACKSIHHMPFCQPRDLTRYVSSGDMTGL